MTGSLRLTLLGVGAMNSPRFPPAGLLVSYSCRQVMLDGGPGAEPAGRLTAWLVSDERSELRRELRELTAARGMHPRVAAARIADLVIEPHPVTHTSHPTWGYLLRLPMVSAAWAPEFWAFPAWAAGVNLMFADAAGWDRPIRFAGGAGGDMAALQVAEQAPPAPGGQAGFRPHRPPLAPGDRCGLPPAVRRMGPAGPHLWGVRSRLGL